MADEVSVASFGARAAWTASDVWAQEAAFVAVVVVYLAWAQWRLPVGGPPFPGPRPVGPVFKVWLVVIWAVGLVLPLVALGVDGFWRGYAATRLAILPYLAMFVAQVAFEIWCWKRWRSPVWVIVPCLFLPWRLWQSWRGIELVEAAPLLTVVTLYALFVLWLINVGVHYTNIPGTLRWDRHPPDADFRSLRDPRVFTRNAQDG